MTTLREGRGKMTNPVTDLRGKVALVTGAARGQARTHATTLARHGADVIAVDVASQIDTVPYPLATQDDLAETAKAVEELDRRRPCLPPSTPSPTTPSTPAPPPATP